MKAPVLRVGLRVLGLFGIGLFGLPPGALAQGQSQLVPLVTEQTPLALSNKFAATALGYGVVNQAGVYVVSYADASFYRPAGATTLVRVIQAGDELPGNPGTRAAQFSPGTGGFRLNSSGLMALQVTYSTATGLTQTAILTFDGTTLRTIAKGTDVAPDSGGATFGYTGFTLGGLNDAGDLLLGSTLVASGTGTPTLFIVHAGGAPIRIAGPGDAAPDTGGGVFSSALAKGLNSAGDVLFSAWLLSDDLDGGCVGGTLYGTKQAAAIQLGLLLPTGNDKDDHGIEKAIERIEKSLDPAYWASDSELTSEGKHVFDEEKNALKELSKVKDTDLSVIQAAIVGVDQTLADDAVNEAVLAGGDPKYLSKAQSYLDKGIGELAKGKFDKAVDNFKKAWENAKKSLP